MTEPTRDKIAAFMLGFAAGSIFLCFLIDRGLYP